MCGLMYNNSDKHINATKTYPVIHFPEAALSPDTVTDNEAMPKTSMKLLHYSLTD